MSYLLRGSAACTMVLAASAATASADGFGASRLWSASFSPAPETPLVGDFNNDGKADAVSFVGDAKLDWRRGDVMVALSNGSALAAPAKWHEFFCMGTEVPVVGDWNGDLKDDIGLFKRSAAGDQAGDVLIALSNGTSFGASQLAHPFFGLGDELPVVGDWNGDGKDDIAVFKRSAPGSQAGDVLVALSNGTSFGASQLWHTDFAFGAEVPMVGDFNGDKVDDIVVFKRTSFGQVGNVRVALSNRSGFGAANLWHPYFAIGDEVPQVGDVNGDGKDDIVVFKRSTAGGAAEGDVLTALSLGSWFRQSEVWHDYFGIGAELPAMADLNADRRDDAMLFKRSGSGSSATGQVLVALNAAPSVIEADWRAYSFGYDTLRSDDGVPARGTRPLLTLLLDFSDAQFEAPRGVTFYRDMLFTGQIDPHTVSGYFRENSFGQFWFSDAGVIAPFRNPDDPSTPVDESRRECAKGNMNMNGGCPGTSSTEALMWSRAIQAAAPTVDFKRFDSNGDGKVKTGELTILFINATVFPDGNGTTPTIACVSVSGPSGSVQVCPRIATVAEEVSFMTLTHELAHLLGTHDLYNSSSQASGATLMNDFVQSSAVRASVELDAWHKIALGWVMPRIFDLTQPGSCEFLYASPADAVFESVSYYERPILLYDPRRGGAEYFLVESRVRDAQSNRYDADVLANGATVWYVQQDAWQRPVMIPGLNMRPNDPGGAVQSVPAPGSDDYRDGAWLWAGGDETFQSTLHPSDHIYWDRAVLQLPVGARRGVTDFHAPGEGQFRARYLLPWDDAELAFDVASIGDPKWLALRWGHHSLQVPPTVGNNDLLQYCYTRFPY